VCEIFESLTKVRAARTLARNSQEANEINVASLMDDEKRHKQDRKYEHGPVRGAHGLDVLFLSGAPRPIVFVNNARVAQLRPRQLAGALEHLAGTVQPRLWRGSTCVRARGGGGESSE